jgi:hypothetical protein
VFRIVHTTLHTMEVREIPRMSGIHKPVHLDFRTGTITIFFHMLGISLCIQQMVKSTHQKSFKNVNRIHTHTYICACTYVCTYVSDECYMLEVIVIT